MNANSFKTIINSTVSISDLTRAGAKKIFDSLILDESKIVLKNNKPVAALVSTDRYQDLLEKEEDLKLLQMAISRKLNSSNKISREEFYKEMKITASDINELPDIEME